MRTTSLLFLLLFALLQAEEPEAPSIPESGLLTSIDSEPSGMIDGCINVISGEFVDSEIDMTLFAPEPLTLQRTLVNNNANPFVRVDNERPVWRLNDHAFLSLDCDHTEENGRPIRVNAQYFGLDGSYLAFHLKRPHHVEEAIAATYEKLLRHGFTNTSQGVISGQTNPRNNILKWNSNSRSAILYDSKGGITEFKYAFTDEEFQFEKYIYHATKEYRSDFLQNRFIYNKYDQLVERKLKNCHGVDLASYQVEYSDKKYPERVTYKTCDGRFVTYKYDYPTIKAKRGHSHRAKNLLKVTRSDAPQINYEYTEGKIRGGASHQHIDWPKVAKKKYPDGRFVQLEYYWPTYQNSHDNTKTKREAPHINRVCQLLAPLGHDQTPLTKYKFYYHFEDGPDKRGCVGVYNALGYHTDYSFDDRQRLQKIIKYDQNNHPYTQESLYWGSHNTPGEIELKCRIFEKFGSIEKIFTKRYLYNQFGDVLHETLFGNLTGISAPLILDANLVPIENGCNRLDRSYKYSEDHLHLLLESSEGELRKIYEYLPGTSLLVACYHCNQEGIYLRHFYDNDPNGMVILHIVDDGISKDRNNLTGITQRKIEHIERSQSYPVGLPLLVSEYYLDEKGKEKLLFRKKNHFDSYGRKIAQDTYDENDQHRYSEFWTYHPHGMIETYTDPIGRKTLYTYDANNNKISEQGPDSRFYKTFQYDFMNRLIVENTHHPDGVLSKKYNYDLIGNLTSTIDALGNSTHTIYDAFNRPIKEIGAPVANTKGLLHTPTSTYEYNELSQITKITNAEGFSTHFKYTIFGKPYFIQYPDGSKEHFIYDLKNNLIKEIAKNGTVTQYTRDHLGRIIRKQMFSPAGELLSETRAGYNTFHLLWEQDPAGILTLYGYDRAGRKTSETKENLTTFLEYDALGRLTKTTRDELVKIQEMDLAGRIIEEHDETLAGEILNLTRYAYDVNDKKISTEILTDQGFARTHIQYDTHGIPILTTDPLGCQSHSHMLLNHYNEYGQHTLAIESIDALGTITLSIQDAQGRVVELIKKTPFGHLIQHVKHTYNSSNKCVRSAYDRILPDGSSTPKVIEWIYDCMNRPTTLIQAVGTNEEKRIETFYNLYGEKIRTKKADGIELLYSYDALGRLKEFTASDNSFDYVYTYDQNSNPLRVDDLIYETTSQKTFDAFGHILTEQLANQLNLNYSYFPDGRLKSVTLPDQSSTQYVYEAHLLKRVERLDQQKNLLYAHEYAYTPSGQVQQSGKTLYKYNLRGELIQLDSPAFKEELAYDAIGNLIQKKFDDEVENYTYDGLNQLTSESGRFTHTYTYDSLFNRLSKDEKEYSLNALDQLLSDEDNEYTYDLCGNVIRITNLEGMIHFEYDALDRPVAIQTESYSRYVFRYDELNRCMQTHHYAGKVLASEDRHLYQGQNEIGIVNRNNALTHLRLLGLSKGSETGAAIAIEIKQHTYFPLHDHQGNVSALLDKSDKVIESYRYSAFGEEKIYGFFGKCSTSAVENPWRFSSKRTLAGFVFFGRRIYNPSSGRWLSPDPIGYEAGPNLYAYVLNNPLTHTDSYGLYGNNQGFDILGFIFESLVNSFTQSTYHFFEQIQTWTGALIRNFFVNVIPHPNIKNFGAYIGSYVETGNYKTYTPEGTDFYEHGVQEDQKTAYLFVNGIMNIFSEAHNSAETMCQAAGIKHCFIAYCATKGLLNDLVECAKLMIGIKTDEVENVIQAIRYSIDSVGGVGNGGIVKIDAHSRGGLTLNAALKYLTAEEKGMLSVSTFGSAALINDALLASCINYISKTDFIPFIASPAEYICCLFSHQNYVNFLSSKSKWFEHGFIETYGDVVEYDAKEFKKNFL